MIGQRLLPHGQNLCLDPMDPLLLNEVREEIRCTDAGAGLILDSDADRCVVLDETVFLV